MQTRKKALPLTPATAEDLVLVELLVDGELGEAERRDLLVRLDRIESGWKICAISFLEAQCLRESFRLASVSAAGKTATKATLGATPAVEVADAFGATARRDATSNLTANSTSAESVSTESESFDRSERLDRFERNGGGFDSLFDGSAARKPVFDEPIDRDRLDEPLIIPLREAVGRGSFRRSNVARRPRRGFGDDGGGPTWRSRLVSAASGFLIAVVLGAIVEANLADRPNVSPGTTVAVSNASNVADKSDDVANKSPFPAFAASGTALADANAGSAPPAFSASGAEAERSPIRVVTLKSPIRSLDGVSVPCVERDRYDAASTPDATDVPPQLAEQLRQAGGHIDSIRDEYRFSLGDGRVLILPVDTYNVRYDADARFQ